MKLEDYYYKVYSYSTDWATTGLYCMMIVPDCDVYAGHFPGQPVCPGVFNLQMIKECVSHIAGKRLKITSIKRCRLLAVATPSECPDMYLKFKYTRQGGDYLVRAELYTPEKVYMELQCTMRSL